MSDSKFVSIEFLQFLHECPPSRQAAKTAETAETAENILTDNKIFDPRELRLALLRKMALVMREEAMAEAAEILDAAELPKEFLSDEILSTSPKNIYGVLPKMNA